MQERAKESRQARKRTLGPIWWTTGSTLSPSGPLTTVLCAADDLDLRCSRWPREEEAREGPPMGAVDERRASIGKVQRLVAGGDADRFGRRRGRAGAKRERGRGEGRVYAVVCPSAAGSKSESPAQPRNHTCTCTSISLQHTIPSVAQAKADPERE